MTSLLEWEGFGPNDPDAPMNNGVPRPIATVFPNTEVVPFGTVLTRRQGYETVLTRRPGYETVANGFGSTTTRPVIQATERQIAFLRDLASRKRPDVDASFVESIIAQGKTRVSAAIEKLLTMADANPDTTPQQSVAHRTGPDLAAPCRTTPNRTGDESIPAGRYAVPTEAGHYAFYKVDRPVEGKWVGWTFVKLLVGSPGGFDEQRMPKAQADTVLAKIAADIEGAARLFGQLFHTCGYCSAPLSNVQSRMAGYGEKCADNHGFWYPTLNEAREWEREQLAS